MQKSAFAIFALTTSTPLTCLENLWVIEQKVSDCFWFCALRMISVLHQRSHRRNQNVMSQSKPLAQATSWLMASGHLSRPLPSRSLCICDNTFWLLVSPWVREHSPALRCMIASNVRVIVPLPLSRWRQVFWLTANEKLHQSWQSSSSVTTLQANVI